MANVITGVRILCGLVLLLFPAFSTWFYVFYLVGGLSDVLDGWTARRLGEVSEFGARLDTIADMVFFGAALIKVFTSFSFPLWIVLWAVGIAALPHPIVRWHPLMATGLCPGHHYMRRGHCRFNPGAVF